MHQELKVVYFVEASPAALAARAARHFVQLAQEAVASRGIARIAISGGSTPKAAFALLADPGEACHSACRGTARAVVGRRALRAAGRPRLQLPHDARGAAGPRAAPAGADSPHGRRAGTGGGCGAVRGGAAEQFPAGGRGDCPGSMSCNWEWVQMDTLRLFFPTLRPCTSWAGWPWPTMSRDKDAWRVTLTWPVINRGSQVFFLIGGADKAQILKEVLTGPRDPERLPSQLIRPAGGILTLLLDRAAAALLPAPDAQGCGVFERKE